MKVEGVVDGGKHAEEALGGSEQVVRHHYHSYGPLMDSFESGTANVVRKAS